MLVVGALIVACVIVSILDFVVAYCTCEIVVSEINTLEDFALALL